jgi:hypothetical protein
MDRIDEPGISYLVAHAGRELSNGLMRHLVAPILEQALASEDESPRERARWLVDDGGFSEFGVLLRQDMGSDNDP